MTVTPTVAAAARSPLPVTTVAVVSPRPTPAPRVAVRVAVVSIVVTAAVTVTVMRMRRLVAATGFLARRRFRLWLSATVGTQVESRATLGAGGRVGHVQRGEFRGRGEVERLRRQVLEARRGCRAIQRLWRRREKRHRLRRLVCGLRRRLRIGCWWLGLGVVCLSVVLTKETFHTDVRTLRDDVASDRTELINLGMLVLHVTTTFHTHGNREEMRSLLQRVC